MAKTLKASDLRTISTTMPSKWLKLARQLARRENRTLSMFIRLAVIDKCMKPELK